MESELVISCHAACTLSRLILIDDYVRSVLTNYYLLIDYYVRSVLTNYYLHFKTSRSVINEGVTLALCGSSAVLSSFVPWFVLCYVAVL